MVQVSFGTAGVSSSVMHEAMPVAGRVETAPTAQTGRLRAVGALREEVGRLGSYEEHHRRLLSRMALILIATGVVDAVGSVATYLVEHSARGSDDETVSS